METKTQTIKIKTGPTLLEGLAVGAIVNLAGGDIETSAMVGAGVSAVVPTVLTIGGSTDIVKEHYAKPATKQVTETQSI